MDNGFLMRLRKDESIIACLRSCLISEEEYLCKISDLLSSNDREEAKMTSLTRIKHFFLEREPRTCAIEEEPNVSTILNRRSPSSETTMATNCSSSGNGVVELALILERFFCCRICELPDFFRLGIMKDENEKDIINNENIGDR